MGNNSKFFQALVLAVLCALVLFHGALALIGWLFTTVGGMNLFVIFLLICGAVETYRWLKTLPAKLKSFPADLKKCFTYTGVWGTSNGN